MGECVQNMGKCVQNMRAIRCLHPVYSESIKQQQQTNRTES